MSTSLTLIRKEAPKSTFRLVKFQAGLLLWSKAGVQGKFLPNPETLNEYDDYNRSRGTKSKYDLYGGPVPLIDLLFEDIERPRVIAKDPARKAHKGSKTNENFFHWRVISVNILPTLEDRIIGVVRNVWRILQYTVGGNVQMWPAYMMALQNEADVTDHVVDQLLEPCTLIINGLIEGYYKVMGIGEEPPFLEHTEQYYAKGESDENLGETVKLFADHVYLLHHKDDKGQDVESPVMIVEDKAPWLVEIKDLAAFHGNGAVLTDAKANHENMVYHLAQELKYSEMYPCSFSVLQDGLQFIAMEWEVPPQVTLKDYQTTRTLNYWNMTANRMNLRQSFLFWLIQALQQWNVFKGNRGSLDLTELTDEDEEKELVEIAEKDNHGDGSEEEEEDEYESEEEDID